MSTVFSKKVTFFYGSAIQTARTGRIGVQLLGNTKLISEAASAAYFNFYRLTPEWPSVMIVQKSEMYAINNESSAGNRHTKDLPHRGWPILLGLLLLAAPLVAKAQFIYTTNAGSLTITGYTGSGGAVTIPTNINGLTVTSIGNAAFTNATSLTSITIPGTVGSIGQGAFQDCTSLTNATLDDGVTNIGVSAFYYCPLLASATIPNSVSAIGDFAFYYCTSLGSLAIPGNPGAIGVSAFEGCLHLTNVLIADGVTSIGSSAFYYCPLLASVTIPSSVTNIGETPFGYCASLVSIGVDGQNADYSGANGALFDKSQTTLVEYPGGLGGAYTIPATVTNISSLAFVGCDGLTNVTIPGGVTSIQEQAFAFCANLDAITVETQNVVYSSLGGVLFDESQATLVEYPGGLQGNYTIPDSVTGIGDYAFAYTAVAGVTIPDRVATIGAFAFLGCAGLGSVTIPGSVSSIGLGAFELCAGLTNAVVGDGVASIGEDAFTYTSLTSVTIPGTVTSIGDSAFQYCANLASVFFQGNAPAADATVFAFDTGATAYYLAGATGWSSPFAGLPAELWNPVIQAGDGSFGVRGNQFGFDITGPPNIPIVVEAASNLANPVWIPLQSVSLTNGLFYFSEPMQTNGSSRYYRISSP
jgi:hypothetical protein